MKRILLLALFLLALAAPAQAATIHEPASEVTVQQDSGLRFDWAWSDAPHYEWSSRLVFTRDPNPDSAAWTTDPSRKTYGPSSVSCRHHLLRLTLRTR